MRPFLGPVEDADPAIPILKSAESRVRAAAGPQHSVDCGVTYLLPIP
jgi:hypothetical protein